MVAESARERNIWLFPLLALLHRSRTGSLKAHGARDLPNSPPPTTTPTVELALASSSYLRPPLPAAQQSWSSLSLPPHRSALDFAASAGRQPPQGQFSAAGREAQDWLSAGLGSPLSPHWVLRTQDVHLDLRPFKV